MLTFPASTYLPLAVPTAVAYMDLMLPKRPKGASLS